MAVTVDSETATQACRLYTSRAAGPSSRRPRPAIHRPKCTPNCAVCTSCTRHSTGTISGSTSGVKNGIPFWQSSTASKDRRCASSQRRIIGYTVNRPPSLTISTPARFSVRAWPRARAARKQTLAPLLLRAHAISQA